MKKRIIKITAVTLLLNFVLQIFVPSVAYALTAGPSSPEFSSFEPVATTDMVNIQSGDFNYNLPVVEIPGPEGSGYALSLSYHGGASAEEEASWVGHGWTLSPGAINRNVRGFPDDYSNTSIDKYNKMPINWTASYTDYIGLDVAAVKGVDLAINLSKTIRFNNNQGIANYIGFSVGAKGIGSINMNTGPQGTTFSGQVDFLGSLASRLSKTFKSSFDISKQKDKKQTLSLEFKLSLLASSYGISNNSEDVKSTAMAHYRTRSFDFVGPSLTVNVAPIPFGFNIGQSGSLNATENYKKTTYGSYGYINNPNVQNYGGDNVNILSDYYVEKSSPYKKRDLFVGVPFNNADNFVVLGEGLSGGFRFFPKKAGHFYPDFKRNQTTLGSAGLTLQVAGTWGFTVKFGLGSQVTKMSKWNEVDVSENYQFANDPRLSDKGTLRFTNDMGGQVKYGGAQVPYAGNITAETLSINGFGGTATPTNSSYIDSHTYDEVKNSTQTSKFDKNILSNVSVNNVSNPKTIVELSIHNTDGMRYIYGQPVFAKNDANLQFDVTPSDKKDFDYIAYKAKAIPLFSDGNVATERGSDGNEDKIIVGEVRKVPYTTNHLLTQITTPDYVDLSDDGLTQDDFGGWTKMHYHKTYGDNTSNGWYRYRSPYNGLLYHRGQLSDRKDDMGSFSSGDKEVFYTKAIETKTHIAFFVTNKSTPARYGNDANGIDAKYLTGSDNNRKDALDAVALTAVGDVAAQEAHNKGTHQLEYLEKIVLFSKTRMTKPLKTTCFKYYDDANSLVQNLPNHANGNFPGLPTADKVGGKLTLQKVWFEYEDIISAKISPYEFLYKYKLSSEIGAEVKAKYPDIFGANSSYVGDIYNASSQNPYYQPHLLDSWGNIQSYAKERQKYMMPWIYQGKEANPYKVGDLGWRGENTINNAQIVDPAAWQLKQIKLPSGGEILIEYEQKDYAFVQDKLPMVMSSLIGNAQNDSNDNSEEPAYTINTNDLGLDNSLTSVEVDSAVSAMKQLFIKDKQKIYFKFLYNLKGNTVPTLNECTSEYISGYGQVKSIDIIPLFTTQKHIRITLTGTQKGDRIEVPRQACFDYFITQRNGKLENNCTPPEEQFDEDIRKNWMSNDSNILQRIGIFAKILAWMKFKNFATEPTPKRADIGKYMNHSLSYLRLPTIKPKKGGGVRVKRLMTYDRGLEQGDAVLYGQEYIYRDKVKMPNGAEIITSSGVATNETSGQREENPMVNFIPPSSSDGWFKRITVGEDKEQTEGPIGESILPSASIGHSRVIVQNIHKGLNKATNTGFTMHEYYTVKDYPYDRMYAKGEQLDYERGATGVEYTRISDNLSKRRLKIPAGLFYYELDKVKMSQGFRFIINSMHGQMRRVGSYIGEYNENNDIRTYKMVSEQTQVYYEPGEKVKMLKRGGTWEWSVPGAEMDTAMEMKSLSDNTVDVKLDLEIALGFSVPPPVYILPSLSVSYVDKGISTHISSKIIRYPVILKKTISIQDGVRAVTENIAFNPITGSPILTRTYDGFDGTKELPNSVNSHDGSMYALNMPATWYYPGMGAKTASTPDYTNQLSASAGSVTSYGASGNPLRNTTIATPDSWAINSMKSILSASAQTFKKEWFSTASNDEIAIRYGFNNPSNPSNTTLVNKLNKIWRPLASYVYRDDVISSNNGGIGIKNGGIMQLPLDTFKYAGTSQSSKWILGSEVQKYTPDGNAVEEKNVIGVLSTADFGYGGKMPILMANNAAYNSTIFKDYEYAPDYLAPPAGGVISSEFAHSGKYSLKLEATSEYPLISGSIPVSKLTDIKGQKGAIVRFWAKSNLEQPAMNLSIGTTAPVISLINVATVGEWTMYKGVITSQMLDNLTTVTVRLTGIAGGSIVYIDDFKIQPKESQATCYVYDVATLRLITQFDDQHFGMFYQYNDEGKLIRKLVETEKGLKTIQETQYNFKTQKRD